MNLSDLGGKSYKNFNSFQNSVAEDLNKQHTETLKNIENAQTPKQTNSEFSKSVSTSLETLVNRKPTIYKSPQTKYP